MEEIEDSDPLSNVRAGWLNRLIGLDNSSSPLQAFNLAGGVPPASLYGTQDTISAPDVDSMRVSAVDQWDHGRRMRSLHRLWDGSSTPMGRAMRATFRAVADFEPVRKTPEQPANGATYPDDDLGRALREVARIVRGNVGVEVVTVDHGDWDHHTELGTLEWGRMIGNASALGESIAAFFQDLGQLGDKVTLVTISEFGRRVKENANQGLDHGWGNVMFLAGAGVKGGKYYADWPWLENTDDADLQVTTDYRSVLSEVIESRFGVSASHVFTDSRFQRETVGVMAGFGAG
jgi:uncharacterized protein (DUF1501 family)